MHGKGMSRGNVVWSLILSILLSLAVGCGDGSPDVVTIKLPPEMVEECWGECPVSEGFEVLWAGEDIVANRLLIGKYATDDYRLRVSKPGYNVLTETDLRNMIFDSSKSLLKVHSTGTITVTISDGNYSGSNNVYHGLPVTYAPMVFWAYTAPSYKKFGNILGLTSLYAAASSGGSPTTRFVAPTLVVEVESNGQEIKFTVTRDCNSGQGTYTFRYYIMVDTAETS